MERRETATILVVDIAQHAVRMLASPALNHTLRGQIPGCSRVVLFHAALDPSNNATLVFLA